MCSLSLTHLGRAALRQSQCCKQADDPEQDEGEANQQVPTTGYGGR